MTGPSWVGSVHWQLALLVWQPEALLVLPADDQDAAAAGRPDAAQQSVERPPEPVLLDELLAVVPVLCPAIRQPHNTLNTMRDKNTVHTVHH